MHLLFSKLPFPQIFLLLCMVGLSNAQTAVNPTGSGTGADPYRIDSLPNLYWLSQTSSAWSDTFVQTSDIDASASKTWSAGAGFVPIGNNWRFGWTA